VNGVSRVGSIGVLAIASLAAVDVRPTGGQPRAGDPIVCPPGTTGGVPRMGGARVEWCERPGAKPPVLDGPFVSRHADGALESRGEYREGKPYGTWKSWHAGGAQSGEVTFVDGKAAGMLLGWYPSGQASFVGGFRDGAPIGTVEIFDAAGRMREAVDFGTDGTQRNRRAWDEADREIDPRSHEALEAEARAVASSPLILRVLAEARRWPWR
jgi:hypothetical protein